LLVWFWKFQKGRVFSSPQAIKIRPENYGAVVTLPDGIGGTVTGLGDLNIFDLFPFLVKKARMDISKI